jgi:hypothetical protein
LAGLVTQVSLYQNILATLVTWTVIWLITRGTLKDVKVSYRQPVLILVLAVAGNLLIDYFKWTFSSSDSKIFTPEGDSLFLNVLINQISLTIIISSMMTGREDTDAVSISKTEP